MEKVSPPTDEWAPLPLDIPPHWEQIDFEDAFENVSLSGLKVPQKEYLPSGTIPIIDQGANLIGGYTNDASKSIQSNRALIVFGDHTKCFKLIRFCFAPGADGVKVLKPITINERFAYYACKALQIPNRGYSRHYAFLKKSKLPLAPLNEQRRIVDKIEELYSELDKGVESLKAARAQLNAYRQAVLKHAFEGKLTARWREENKDKLETTEQLLARIKQERTMRYELQLKYWKISVKGWEKVGKSGRKPSKPKKPPEMAEVHQNVIALLPELPEGWCWVRVGDCCEVVRGGSPRPAGDTRYYNGSIPFLKVADLTRTGGVYLDTHSFSIKEAGLHKTRLVEPPILMLSNSGATLGVPKVCRIKTTFNDGIAAFLGLDLDDILYHYYFWASKTLQLRAINQGAAQPNLNTDLIKETVIPLCTHAEMQIVANHIGRLLSICDQLVARVESQLLKIDALRQSVLKKAFSGQLVAQNSHDEPASVILERIKAEKEQVCKGRNGGKKTRQKKEGTS